MADRRNDIERYLGGDMSSAEMHALEKQALHDPFLADALEGGSNFPHEFSDDVTGLDHRITTKVARKRQSIRWYYQAAAALLLLGVSAVLIYYLSGRGQAVTPITMNNRQEKPAQENRAPLTDSIPTEESPESETADQARAKKQEVAPAQSKPAEETPATPKAQTADDGVDEHVAAVPDETEADLPPAESNQLIRRDSMDVQSFALQQSDKRETAGAVARQRAPAPKINSTGITQGQTIRGKVTDIEDGLPLPGVNVIAKGSSAGTVTDLNGNYELKISEPAESLVFSFIGLQSREVSLSPATGDTTNVNVQMEPDVSSLSEVVVLGYGTESDVEFEATRWEPAEPAGGKRAFRRYLESNLRYPEVALENKVEGKVTVQFTIEPTGTLTDFRIVRSMGYGCDEEVIRLIKEGPRWKPTKRNDEPVRGKGKVKLRFALPANKK